MFNNSIKSKNKNFLMHSQQIYNNNMISIIRKTSIRIDYNITIVLMDLWVEYE